MNKNKKKFMKNIGIIMFSQIIIKFIGVFYKLYLTNNEKYGDLGNAIFGAAFQIYAIFLTISSIGVPNAISKLVSDKMGKNDISGAYRILKIGLIIFGGIGFLCTILLYLFAEKIAYIYLQIPETKDILIVMSPSIFFVSIEAVLKGYFYGKENMKIIAKAQTIEQIVKTVFTMILIEIISKLYVNTLLMVLIVAIIGTFANIINVAYLFKYYLKNRKEIWKEILRNKYKNKEKAIDILRKICEVSIPITIIALLAAINKTVDAFTIVRFTKQYLTENEARIQYGILSGKIDTLINLPLSFNIAFATTLIPTVSAAFANKNIAEAKERINESLMASIIIGIPSMAIMYIFPKEILSILFPNAMQGAQMLKISSISIILIVLIQTISGAIQGIGANKILIIGLIFGGIVKTILNGILLNIQNLGIQGAIIATIISHMIVLIIIYCGLIKKIKLHSNFYKHIIKTIISTIIMLGIIYASYKILGKSKTKFVISLFLGGIMYLILNYKLMLQNIDK